VIARTGTVKYLSLILGLTACTFAGLNWNIGTAAWIAPVFLLFFTKNTRWFGFLLFCLGMAISAAISKTAENLSGIFMIYITTGLSYGVIHSVPYLIEKLLVNRENRFYSTLIFPSAVVFTEYLLSLGLGIWGNASVAQYPRHQLIQITSVFGIFGLSFLVAWLASTVNWIIQNGYKTGFLLKGIGVYGLVLVAVISYGAIRSSYFPSRSDAVNVAAIVSDTDIHEVFREREAEIIALSKNYHMEIPADVYSGSEAIASQLGRTREAMQQGARIVVWNEISLILEQSVRDTLLLQLGTLCRENRSYVLAAYLEKNEGARPKPFNNTSVLITPGGDVAWTYVKSYPTPLEKLIVNRGDASLPFMDTEYGRIGNAICSDIDVPAYMSQLGKNRIDILLVPAYDWKQITPYHSQMAVFTALQFGVSMVRANGKGVTAFYDYRGKVLAESNTFTSDSKISYSEVPIHSTTTLYSIIGNVFVYAAVLYLLLMLVLRLREKGHQ
jgi:apolipoprotein N-acyltransferase